MALRLEVRGGRVLAEMDGRLAWTCPVDSASLDRFAGAPGGGNLGIAAWGAPVAIRAMRFQALDAETLVLVEESR